MRWHTSLTLLIIGLFVLASCQSNLFSGRNKAASTALSEPCDSQKSACPVVQTPGEDTMRPKHRAKAPPTGPGFVEGVSAASLDETTAKEKQAALDADRSGAEKKLGKTIASLGDVGQQGFWLKTPLVLAQVKGRIVWAADGGSVRVMLIPKQGEGGSGSQISLAAMRALGIPLTVLAELIVFSE